VERKQKQKTKKEKIKHLNACANMEAIESMLMSRSLKVNGI
jgi:hypothetical protein